MVDIKKETRTLNIEYSAIFGTYWMIYAVVSSFASVFMLARGYSNSQIGITLAAANVLAFIMQPLIADFTDRSKRLGIIGVTEIMTELILKKTGMVGLESFHTIHNYIDTDEMILRKGAIAAHKGERVLIPINMRDGSVLAVGKGNPEWNWSAPHGAGRLMSRRAARDTLDMAEYEAAMQGIYTTSVNAATLDESPMAYKSLADIIGVIADSVDVIEVMKPIYNFKASD